MSSNLESNKDNLSSSCEPWVSSNAQIKFYDAFSNFVLSLWLQHLSKVATTCFLDYSFH